jgi:tetratricopeptide (TPR) repeat protein
MKCQRFILAVAVLFLSGASALAAEPEKLAQADALLASPALDYQKAQQALALYEELPSRPPALLTQLARTCFILGDLAPKNQRAGYYEKGLAYAERLIKEQPGGVAGHYWKALNLSGLADVGSQIQGFKLLPKIMEELKRVLVLDETYDQAGAHRVLGRIYFKAPSWPISVGDKKKSLRHLETAVRLAPNHSTNHLYLAETLLDQGKKAQARPELEKVLPDGQNGLHPQALKEDRQEARRLLEEMKKEKGVSSF